MFYEQIATTGNILIFGAAGWISFFDYRKQLSRDALIRHALDTGKVDELAKLTPFVHATQPLKKLAMPAGVPRPRRRNKP